MNEDEVKQLMSEELKQLKKLSIEHEIRQKQSAMTMTLQVLNSMGLVAVLSAAFYFGIWKGGVDQVLHDYAKFKDAGDRYPSSRGIATETRLLKLEKDHDEDVKQLRKESQEIKREILIELREIRKLMSK
jgi:hypothetical protein